VPPAAQTRPKTRPVPVGRQGCPVTWVPGHPDAHLLWRNLLVTNDEFAAFLSLAVTNHGYQDGDTVPSAEPGRGPGEIHHLVGNLQVWCCDGPAAGHPCERVAEIRADPEEPVKNPAQ
jgi:hypothetical protein